jgi:hypothetical protein
MFETERPMGAHATPVTPARPRPVVTLAVGVSLAGGVRTAVGQNLLAGSGGWFMLASSAAPSPRRVRGGA